MGRCQVNDKKSTHKTEIVPVMLENHPNADSLSVVSIGGYRVVVRTNDWVGINKGAYLVPDSLVDVTRPEFSFLADGKNQVARIKVRKLRGVISMGLLIPAPEGSLIGDDVSDILGVTRYEPPEPMSTGGETENPPEGYHPQFDVEALQKYIHVFEKGEPVFVTEKCHGGQLKACFSNGRIFCGSKKEWKKESESNVWWKALKGCPQLEELCMREEVTVYGEVLGIQDLKYGYDKGKVGLVVFDILQYDRWFDPLEAVGLTRAYDIPFVPVLGTNIPFDFDKLQSMADGNSFIPGAKNIREGVVIRPMVERQNDEIGRVVLKLVSNVYLSGR